MSGSQLQTNLDALNAQVTAETDFEVSLTSWINGVPALINTAVSQAIAAGATPAQLKAVTDATTAIATNIAASKAAILANTPQAAPPDTTTGGTSTVTGGADTTGGAGSTVTGGADTTGAATAQPVV